MTENFNKLTAGQTEALAILSEECGEVIQAVAKILRHGYNAFDPTTKHHPGNRHDLETEIGQMQASVTTLVNRGDLNVGTINSAYNNRQMKMRSGKGYLHHQEGVRP